MSEDNPFAGRSTRVLSVADIRTMLSMDDALQIQRAAFTALAGGHVTAAPNAWVRLPDQQRRRGWIKVLGGHESSTGSLGVKVLARFADNPPGANLGSLLLLFDDEDGFPLAIMDGTVITGLRTGAGAGLATDSLSPRDVDVVGVIGTGVVARDSLTAVHRVRPGIRRIRVHSRSPDRRAGFARWATSTMGVAAEAVTGAAEAVTGAEVVITATNSPEPVLGRADLVPGQMVNAMGIRTELAPDLLADSLIVPDGTMEAASDGKASVAIAAGVMSVHDLGPSLGEVLTDPPGHMADRIVVFDSSGVAVQDITMAREAWRRATEADVGTTVDLGLGEPL